MPVHDLDRVPPCSTAQAGRQAGRQTGRQAGCSTISHETVKAVKRLITPCQVKAVFILMSWNSAIWENLAPAIIYWKDSDRQWTRSSLKSSKKKQNKKTTFPPPNEAVLSNIYGTKRKQGQTVTFTDMVISCCRHMIQARAGAKESQPLCLEEVLISQWPGDLFKRATGWISTCVQKLGPRSVSKRVNYTRFLRNTVCSSVEPPSSHLQINQISQFGRFASTEEESLPN